MALDREGQDLIWDSGASDSVTGNRYALHDFIELEIPIAVRVATDGMCNYITCMGTLIFAGINSTTVTVKQVYYCKNARSTLLSVAAFKKSNTTFQVGRNFTTIDLLSASGKLILRSEFDPTSNTWPLPRPNRVPDSAVDSAVQSCNPRVPPPIEIKSVFKSPHGWNFSQYSWSPAEMSKDERALLFRYRLFGHASLRQIRRMVKLNLGHGLPEIMPAGTIKSVWYLPSARRHGIHLLAHQTGNLRRFAWWK